MRNLSGTQWVGKMTDEEYHADPCATPSLSSSLAKILDAKSPSHAYLNHPRLGGSVNQERTPSTSRGTVTHAYIMGTDSSHIFVLPEDKKDFRTKEAQELRDAAIAKGLTPILHKQHLDFVATSNVLREKMLAKERRFVTDECENVIVWEEIASSGRVVQCRAKLDNFSDGIITDLKSSEDASPEAISRTVANYRYNIQAASNISGISTVFPELVGRVKFRWVFYETEPPYAVTRCSPSARDLALGACQWRRAVDIWDACMHSGRWPDYEDDEMTIEQPGWAAARITDRLMLDGMEVDYA